MSFQCAILIVERSTDRLNARQQFDNNSMAFDLQPLCLDFPALVLYCLRAPPTLFSATVIPTSTSWSLQTPGDKEYKALEAHFEAEFRNWRVKSSVAGMGVNNADMVIKSTQREIIEHLQSAYGVWQSHTDKHRHELWVLELCRNVDKKQKDLEERKEQEKKLIDENACLKAQINHLHRLYQRKDKIDFSPATISLDGDLISQILECGVMGGKAIAYNIEARHVDVGAVVGKAIEHWKGVISASRQSKSGMAAQKPLGNIEEPRQPATAAPSPVPPPARTQVPAQPPPPKHQPQSTDRNHAQSVSDTQTAESANEEYEEGSMESMGDMEEDENEGESSSDQDADADADDDEDMELGENYPDTLSAKPLLTMPARQGDLDVPRSRPVVSHATSPIGAQFAMAAPDALKTPLTNARSMPNMNAAAQQPAFHANMGLSSQGDPMFMD